MELFDPLDPLLKTFWYIAIPSSIIFLLQSIMTLIGSSSHYADSIELSHSTEVGTHDTPFQLFSLRNLINFLLGFSWGGIAFHSVIENSFLLIAFSFGIGTLFVFSFFALIKLILKLAEDNTFTMEQTLFKTGEVYLTIPEKRTGKGKVLISVNGAVHELDAMTEYDAIQTNTPIKVINIEHTILLVEPL
jgi:hypothetical protein